MNPLIVHSACGAARLPGAAEALAALMAQRQAVPFAWGTHDCVMWAADAVHAQVGIDPASAFRGRYATALQAQRVITLAGGSLHAVATRALGAPLLNPMLACAGDIGLVQGTASADWPDRATLAVCLGAWYVAPAARGLGLYPLTAATAAWKVGCA